MNDNRRKLTGILKLLYENTDAEHSMNTYQIMDALESMGYGRPDRKTIDANIKFIIEDLRFGIKKEKGKPNRYRWTDREFDISELKLVVDAVHASKFITQKKSRVIIAKLKDLTSVYQAALLNRDFYTTDSFQYDGNQAIPAIDVVHEAIRNQNRISFQLAEFDIDKTEVLCSNGKQFEVSPAAIILNNDRYYLLGFQHGSSEVSTFRVDMIRNASIRPIPAQLPADFDLSTYKNRVFDMMSGEVTDVILSCKDSTISSLIDKFGTLFYTQRTGPDRFIAKVSVDTSPAFYAWVFGHGGDISIAEPAWVRDEYMGMLSKQIR